MFSSQHGWEYCNFRLELHPNYRPVNPPDEDDEEISAAVRLLVGIALVVVAEVFYQS